MMAKTEKAQVPWWGLSQMVGSVKHIQIQILRQPEGKRAGFADSKSIRGNWKGHMKIN